MSRMPRTKVFNTNLIMGFVNLSASLATNHPLLINAHKKLDRYILYNNSEMQPSGLKFRQTLKNSFFFLHIPRYPDLSPQHLLGQSEQCIDTALQALWFSERKGIQILHQAPPTMYLHSSCLPARYVRSSHNQREREEAEKVWEHN